MSQTTYHEFAELPAWTRAVWDEAGQVCLNEADPYKWSARAIEPPKIGAKVETYLNGLGRGTVTGYFVEHGWFGVLVRFHKAPPWYVKKNGRYQPGHIFGIDLEPRKEKAA